MRPRSYRRASYARLAALVIVTGATLAACVSIPDPRLQQSGPAFSADALPATGFRVTSWNVHKAEGPAWQGEPATHRIASQLAAADLLLLQEACAPEPSTPLGQTLPGAGLTGVFAASFAAPILGCPEGHATGVLTASRAAPRQRQILASDHREFGLTPKASLATTYALSGSERQLLVINAHLLNFEWLTLDDYGDQLADIARVIAAHDGPVILAGDMNSRSAARTEKLEAVTRQAGLRPVFDQPDDARTRAVIGGDKPLDHIYYRGVRLAAPGTIGGEADIQLSDHNSLSATFVLP